MLPLYSEILCDEHKYDKYMLTNDSGKLTYVSTNKLGNLDQHPVRKAQMVRVGVPLGARILIALKHPASAYRPYTGSSGGTNQCVGHCFE